MPSNEFWQRVQSIKSVVQPAPSSGEHGEAMQFHGAN